MAKTVNTTIKFTGQFDSSGITKGLQDIKKQMSNSHIGEDLRKQLEGALSKVEANIPALEKFAGKGEYNSKELEAFQKVVQQVSKDMQALDKLVGEADFTKVFSEADTAKVKQFEKQLSDVENKIKSTKQEIIKAFSESDAGKVNGKSNATLNGYIKQLLDVPPDQMKDKLDEIIKDVEQQADNAVNKLQQNFQTKVDHKTGRVGLINLLFGEDSGVTLKEGKTLNDPRKNGVVIGEGAYTVFNKIREQVLALEKDAGPDKINPILEAYSKFINEFFNVPEGKQSVLTNIVTPEIVQQLKQFSGPEGLEKLKNLLGNQYKILQDGEAEKLRISTQYAQFLSERLQFLGNAGVLTKEQIALINKELGIFNSKIDEGSGKIGKEKAQADALSATFSSLAHRITSSVSALTVFNRSIQIVRQAINSVRELDAAFTQIAIVSEQSNEQAWQMFDSFNKLAKQYSITTKDLTEGAKLFYQQGLNAADTMKMVEASTISAALGEVTMAEAANTLTAAIQGYNESADVAMAYTDKIAMVGAVSAADFNELSAAMEKTASSAYTAGIDFDHLLGYLGKMIEVTREAPANLGTAMKTIIARFEDMKKDPAALIDGASANKVEAALATIGIALRDVTGEFRPLQEVFDELGMKWQDLTRNQQAYIATVAAGSRQQSRFLAMMNNYPRTLELIRESQNSAGAALKQYETYQDSAAAATARLTAAWEEFYKKVADPERITNIINLLTRLVETMSKIGPIGSTIIATFGAHTINRTIKGGGLVSKLIKLAGQELKSSSGETISVTIGNVFRNGIDLGIKQGLGKFTNSNFSEYQDALKKAGQLGTEKGIISGLGSVGTKIGSILAPIISSLGPILAGVLIAAIITAIGIGIAKAHNYAEEKEQRWLKQYSEKIKENREKVDEYKKEKRAIEDNYEVYKKYNKQIILTDDELKEQNEAVEKIQEQYKDLIVITDELGRKNILNTDQLEQHTEELKKQTLELEKQNALEKYNALNPSPAQKRKYGDSDEYMKDWTTTQLMNVGYSEQEAEILDKYGNLFNNREDKDTRFLFSHLYNTPGRENLQSLIAKRYSEYGGENQGSADVLAGQYVDTILSKDSSKILDLVDNINFKLENTTGDIKNFYMAVKDYAQLALDGLDIINARSGDYAKTLLNLNLENINNSSLQNDLSNIFTNLSNFNNGAFLEQFNEKNLKPEQTIEEAVNEASKEIEDVVNNFDPIRQHSFHELSKKLLDPSLSYNDRDKLVKDFQEDAKYVSKQMDNLLQQYVEGSNVDIKRRENLNEKLGITDKEFLKQFNSKQLQIIDQFRTANKNTGFNIYEDLLKTDYGPQLIKSLSTLEQDILDDPAVYTRAQGIMVEFFQRNFTLNAKDAYDTFYEMFGDMPEAAMDAAEDSFKNAQDLIMTDPTKALSKKQSEEYQKLESVLGESLRYYIEINEQGEEYLSIAGRIAILEKTALKYENSILATIGQLEADKKQIAVTNEELTEENKHQIVLIDKEIELNKEKLEILKETQKYTAQTTAALNNIDYATEYDKNVKTIKDARKEMLRANAVLDKDTAKALMSMGTGYRRYLTTKMIGEDKYYTLTKENADLMIADQRRVYQEKLDEQKKDLDREIKRLEDELTYFQTIANGKVDIEKEGLQEQYEAEEKKLDDELQASEKLLEDQLTEEAEKNDKTNQDALKSAQEFEEIWSTAYTNLRNEWNQLATAMGAGEPTTGTFDHKPYLPIGENAKPDTNITTPDSGSPKPNEGDKPKEPEIKENDYQARAKQQVARINEALERLRAARAELEILGTDFEDTSKSGAKTEDEMKKLTAAIEKCTDALKDLDDLLIDVKRDLADIDVDYSPFMDLFEAWEHEWDYYYNIKQLIAQLGQQGQWIDNIISADYTSAEEKMAAYDAKIGNITAKMAANDAYILTLRQGIAKNALELEKKFGQYYNVDNVMGSWQVYQKDTNLHEWNDIANAIKKASYELSKVINQQENELNLLEATQDALEQERSAYESILNTVDSVIDSLKDNEDITVDLSELQGVKAELEIAIKDKSVEEIKQKVRELNDYIQELQWQLDLNDNVVLKGIDDAVEDMEELRDKIQDYIDTMNEAIAEQQELIGQLSEVYNYYIDTAISTEQELYNAIVENYQNEINQKKKQYDYLKQLDNDYLNSIKDNINKERQAREEANKQKDYQQNIQRAQLLSMDTSGAYRKELASLNKEIENQRQDLYDDLVDKQVEALEKEIEKRHELYDMEVAALEERLAYMQENAILLWEMVNNIVADGSETMMSTLENTMDYINSNELSKERQRKQWELSIQTTIKGVVDGEIENLKARIDKGNEYIKSIEEIKTAIELNTETYQQSTAILIEENENYQNVMDAFMQSWTDMTNGMTGYYESWKTTVNNIKLAIERDIEELTALGEDGGGIKELEAKLRQSATDMYNSFIEERRSYKNQLEGIIKDIETKIGVAVQRAANAISGAANNIKVNTTPTNTNTGSTQPTTQPSTGPTGQVQPTTTLQNKYKVDIIYYENEADYRAGKNSKKNSTLFGYNSFQEAEWAAIQEVQSLGSIYRNRWYKYLMPVKYKYGGLADFTGPAWLDGTKDKPERVLSPKQTKLFESMVSSLEKASNNSNINSGFGSSYNIGNINTTVQVDKLDDQTDVNKLAKQVEDKIVKTIRNRVSVSINKGV